MRRLIFALILCAGCAGSPETPSLRPDVAPGPSAQRVELHRQSEIWRQQRRETALADLARIPDLLDEDARRITLARILRLSPDVLLELEPTRLARLSPTVLRIYRIREALDEGPDSPLAGRVPAGATEEPDGRERRALRLAGLVRESLSADRWPSDGTFLILHESDLLILQCPERFAAIEDALDRHVSSRGGSIRLRVDLIPDGEGFARGLGFSRHDSGRKAWLPRAPAEAVAGQRLASARLDVPWGRRVGTHVAPGYVVPVEGPADTGRPETPPADAGGPGLTIVAMRLPAEDPADPTEHFDLEIIWRAAGEAVARDSARHRTSIAVRPDLPALLVWPDGPGAILWVTRGPHARSKPRPAWRRLLP